MKTAKKIDLNAPPIEWFSKPADLKPGSGMTITDDGHVSGYLCLWNARFINGGRGNVKPPRGGSYSFANAFKTKATAEIGNERGEAGTTISCGVLAGTGGHKFKDGFASTQAAYADIDTKFARVKYGEDSHGCWFSGALMPGLTDEQITAARASGVSGHWERPTQGGKLELLGAVLVNLPAFAQAADPHRIAAAATIEETATGGIITNVLSAPTERPRPKKGDQLQVATGDQVLTAAGDVQAPISGRLLQLNTETVDGRVIKEVEWMAFPLPLFWCESQSYGHNGSTVVGAIQSITVAGDEVTFDGVLDAAFLAAQGAKDVGDLGVLGVSIDGAVTGDVEFEWDDDNDGFWPDRMIFTLMQILGATLTSMPAFHSTLGLDVGDFSGDTTEAAPTAAATADTQKAAGAMTIRVPFGATDFKDLPLDEREAEWDSTAADDRVREWAGGEEIDWEKYRQAFFWYDTENAEEFGGYKLGFADIVDGELTAVPKGVFAVAGVLDGARGGVDIPEADMDDVKAHVAKYYDKMATEFEDDTITPPWEDASATTTALTEGSRTAEGMTIVPPIVWGK